ncbi:hypothetical protein [Lacinutrix mariniflava]|nr:hypothetical protein [Lacinutrix mariniflava]
MGVSFHSYLQGFRNLAGSQKVALSAISFLRKIKKDAALIANAGLPKANS